MHSPLLPLRHLALLGHLVVVCYHALLVSIRFSGSPRLGSISTYIQSFWHSVIIEWNVDWLCTAEIRWGCKLLFLDTHSIMEWMM